MVDINKGGLVSVMVFVFVFVLVLEQQITRLEQRRSLIAAHEQLVSPPR